ncbi:MAG: PLP-dependent aminotransferase family protein [Candidatus Eisenbacteria bacterium]
MDCEDHIGPIMTEATTEWDSKLSERSRSMKPSFIREILKFTQMPDVISFAGGLPAPELFPIREFEEACAHVLRNDGQRALQYGPTEGFLPLKEALAEKMNKYDIACEPHNILLTNGSQQALDLLGRVFIDPGDVIVTGAPTYIGALQAFKVYGPRIIGVPVDDEGMRVDVLEDILKQETPKFIYVLPNFHNPMGVTLTLERRIKLIKLAAKHGIPIIEDDPYGELRFEGEDIAPIYALHKQNVIYLSTFSKILSPGIRLGWVVGPEGVIRKIVLAKQANDLHTGTFVQMITHDIMKRGILKAHSKELKKVYGERRHIMTCAMEEFFPKGASWTRPKGGLFMWAITPDRVSTMKLIDKAVEKKVAFVPGCVFYPDDSGDNTMRLNFSNAQPDNIREGIKRLGIAIAEAMG